MLCFVIGLTNKDKVLQDNDDNILNFDWKIAGVIHQYDRKHKIVEKLKIKFNDCFIFSKNYTLIKEQSNKNNPKKSLKKVIKYIFVFNFLIIIIIIYLVYSYINKKRRMNFKKFKKEKLKVFRQQSKMRKLFEKFYNKKNNYYKILQEKENVI